MNAVLKEVKVEVNERRLLANSRFAFSSTATVIREMIQNGRRAGATRIDISTPNKKTLVFTDNGSGIADMQDLLRIADSGWEESIKDTDSPFGMGFLVAVYSCNHLKVVSGNQQLECDTASLLDMQLVQVVLTKKTVKGTRIELTGGNIEKLIADITDPKPSRGDQSYEAIRKEARGFPIPVYFNGTEVERPDVETDGFEDCAVGRIHFTPTKGEAYRAGKFFYLQGMPLPSNDRFGHDVGRKEGIVKLHLDARRFKGRMPDRDTLVEPENANDLIEEAITEYIRGWLIERKTKMEPKAFLERFGQMCQMDSAYIDLLDDVEFALAQWFDDVSDPNASEQDRQSLFVEGGILDKATLEAKGVMLAPGEDEYTGFIQTVFARGKGYFVWSQNQRFSDSHWLNQLAVSPDRNDFALTIEGEKRVKEGQDCQFGEVIACEAFSLTHPELGTVRIDDVGLYTGEPGHSWGMSEEELDAAEKAIHLGLIIIPPNASVVEQLSDFCEEDVYNEAWYDTTCDEVSLLNAMALGLSLAGQFSRRLSDAGLGHAKSEMKGASFTVTFDADGYLKSVVQI